MAGHILYGASEPSIATSDDGYYPVAAQVGEHVNKRSARTNITAVVGAEAGMGAPACFIPSLAEVHLNTTTIDLGPVDKVDYADALWRLTHAAAVGAMDHEAAHARHTKWDPNDLIEKYGATRKMIDVITTLEEPRIEANSIRIFGSETQPFLRGCAMEIIARDFEISDSRYGASVAAGLLLARVDARVLTRAEVRTFRRDIEAVLGTETLDALETLWRRFLRLRDFDFAGMVDVAREWLEVLGEDPEDTENMAGESMVVIVMPAGSGEGEGEGSGSGGDDTEDKSEDGDEDGEGGGSGDEDGEAEPDPAEGFGDKFMGKVRIAEVKMDREMVGKAGDEMDARAIAEAEADAERKRASEKPHEKAFGKPGVSVFTPDGFSHLTEIRDPSDAERRAAKSLARDLEKIDYRDRAVSKVSSMVPPGRLRGGVAMQGAAARAMGRDADLPLWQGKRRVKVDSTPLTIGFLVDISGSMSSAMEPLASTQYVVTNAGSHIEAKVASVHFGRTVHGVTPVGYKERQVRVFYPGDGTEAFRAAALAADRELNLLDGRGARVLFVASDGEFVSGPDKEYAQTFVPLALRKGVAVIFLNFTGRMPYGTYGASVVDCYGLAPTEVANVVGKAAITEMRRIDRRL